MSEVTRIITARITVIGKGVREGHMPTEEELRAAIKRDAHADHVEIMQIQDFIREDVEEKTQNTFKEQVIDEFMQRMKARSVAARPVGWVTTTEIVTLSDAEQIARDMKEELREDE